MKVATVYIEITNQCNLNCRTCYNRSGLNRQPREISPRQLEENILPLFTWYGCRRFLFSGGSRRCIGISESSWRSLTRTLSCPLGL